MSTSTTTNIFINEPSAPKVRIRQYELGETNSRVTVNIEVPSGSVTFFIPAPNDGSKTIHTFVEEICAALAAPIIDIIDT